MSEPKKEPENLRKLKARWQKIEGSLRTDPEPGNALKSLEKWILEIETDEDERFEFFVDKVLLKAVRTLILRGDLKPSFVPRVATLLTKITAYCVRFMSNYEFATSILDIVLNSSKKTTFYKTYGHSIKETLEEAQVDNICNSEWDVSNYLIACINVFIKNEGDKVLLQRLRDKENKLTFSSLVQYHTIINHIHDMLEINRGKRFISESVQCIFDCMLNFGEDEARGMTRSQFQELMEETKKMLVRFFSTDNAPDKSAELMDNFRLKLAEKFLKMKLLSQRLHGVDDICFYCRQTTHPDPKNDPVWVDASYVAQWLLDHQIVEYIYKETDHQEIFRRSADILVFLAHERALKPEHLDIIYAATLDKHESITHQVWLNIGTLSTWLDSASIDYLWEKIRVFPVSSYDKEFLRFVKQITSSGIRAAIDNRKKGSGNPIKWYGLEMFWNTLLDSTPVPLEIHQTAILEFQEVISWGFCRQQRTVYMDKCILNLKEGNSVPQSLVVLKHIIATYNQDTMDDKDRNINAQHVINHLNKEFQLVNLCFVHLEKYSNHAANIKIPDGISLDNFLVVRHYTHLQYLDTLISFLDFTFSHSGLSMSREHVDVLWDSTIVKATTEKTREIALRWLQHVKTPGRGNSSVSDDMCIYIFDKKIPTLDFRSLTTVGFKLFECYFQFLNTGAQQKEHVGLDVLWRIALEAENAQVGEEAIDFMNRLQTGGGRVEDMSSAPHALKQRETYLSRCVACLQEASNALKDAKTAEARRPFELKVHRSIALLRKFIDSFDTNSGVEKHGSGANEQVMFRIIPVGQNPSFNVEINTNETVGDLRVKVATRLETTPDMIRFIRSGKEILEDTVRIKNSSLANAYGQPIHVNRRQNPLPPSNTTPTLSLSEEERKWLPNVILARDVFFEQFFALLNTMSGPVCGQIWEILEKLPTNQRMHNEFRDIKGTVNWNSLLDHTNLYKLYYSLQIIESLLDVNGDLEFQEKWRRNFMEAGGLVHLVHNVLLKTEFFETGISNNKRILCLALLLKIINYFVIEPVPIGQVPKLRSELLRSFGVPPDVLMKKFIDVSLGASLPQNVSELQTTGLDLSVVGTYQASPSDKVVMTAIPLIVALATDNSTADALGTLLSHSSTPKWVDAILFSCPFRISREVASVGFFQICTAVNLEQQPAGRNPTAFFLRTLINLVPRLVFHGKENEYQYTCVEFFRLLDQLLGLAIPHTSAQEFESFLKMVSEMISVHPIIELNGADPPDEILIGLLRVTKTLLTSDPAAKKNFGATLLKLVFHNCLFEIPPVGHQGDFPPLCKTTYSRTAAFNLLLEITRDSQENLNILAEELIKFHKKQPYKKQWQYLPSLHEKSPCGFVGLKNLGCTCYMNSLMQQLFMHTQLRYGLLSVLDTSEDKSESVLYQLQSIFANLQESAKKYYDPEGFTKAYKDEGQPMKVTEQMDVDEFMARLFDKLETILKGTPQEKVLQRFFGGVMLHQIVSKECPHKSEREEKFFALQMEVKGKFKLHDALDLFVQGEILDGDNKYHCDGCSTKVAALKRVCLGKLPNHLIVHFKRFEFDLETLRRIKVNSYCEFPMRLNVEPYTAEGIARREQANGDVLPPPAHPMEYYDYELTGILVHIGTSDSGHYYSFIRDSETKKWFQFNDTNVSSFDPAHIQDQCFGGEDIQNMFDNMKRRSFQRKVPKSYNAYLLFYERCVPSAPDVDVAIPKTEQSKVVPKELFDQVWDKNLKFLMDKVLFDKDYTQFLYILLQGIDPQKLPQNTSGPYHLIDLGTRFFVQTLSHARERDKLPEFVKLLQYLYSIHLPSSRWLLEFLTSDNAWSYQMLLLSPIPNVQEEFARLVIQAATTVYASEGPLCIEANELEQENSVQGIPTTRGTLTPANKKPVKNGKDQGVFVPTADPVLYAPSGKSKSSIILFLESLLKMYPDVPAYSRNFTYFFWVFSECSQIGDYLRRAMTLRGFIRILAHLFMGENSPHFQGKKLVPLKDSTKEKERKKIEQVATANMKYAVSTIAYLSRGLIMPRDPPAAGNTVAPSPTQLTGELLEILRDDFELIFSEKFLSKALSEGIFPVQIGEMVQHYVWENWTNSQKIIEFMCNTVNKEDADIFPPFFVVFRMMLTLSDSLNIRRVDFAMEKLLKVISDNIMYKMATLACLRFLQELLPLCPRAREIMFSKFTEWAPKWILYHPRDTPAKISIESYNNAELLRNVAECIVMELVPEVKGYVANSNTKPLIFPSSVAPEAHEILSRDPKEFEEKSKTTPGVPKEEIIPQLSASVKQRLHTILRALYKLLDISNEDYKNACSVNVDIRLDTIHSSIFKLQSLLRLISWASASPDERKFVLENPHFNNFLVSYQSIDGAQKECDFNRLEATKLWEKLTRNCPETVSAFANNQSSQNYMWSTFISIKPDRQYFSYNNEILEFFYTVYLRCALSSRDYLLGLTKHQNYKWGIKYILLDSPEYPRATRVLKQLIDLSIKISPEFRRQWVVEIIPEGVSHHNRSVNNGVNVFDTLARFLQDVPEQIEFYKVEGIKNLNTFIREARKADKERPEATVRSYLTAYYRAISWLCNKNLTEEMGAIKHNLLNSNDLNSITQFSIECLNMETYREKPHTLEAAHTLILHLYNVGSDLFRLNFLIPTQPQARGILDVQTGRRKHLSKCPINPEEIEARRKHVNFLQSLVAKYLCDFTKPEIFERAVILLLFSAIEALALPLDVLKSVLANIDSIGDPSEISSNSYVTLPPGTVEYTKKFVVCSNMGEFLAELVAYRYKDLSDKSLLSFFKKYHSKLVGAGVNMLLCSAARDVPESLSRELQFILGRIQEGKVDKLAEDINSIFTALLLFYSTSQDVVTAISHLQKEILDLAKNISELSPTSLTISITKLIKLLNSF